MTVQRQVQCRLNTSVRLDRYRFWVRAGGDSGTTRADPERHRATTRADPERHRATTRADTERYRVTSRADPELHRAMQGQGQDRARANHHIICMCVTHLCICTMQCSQAGRVRSGSPPPGLGPAGLRGRGSRVWRSCSTEPPSPGNGVRLVHKGL